MRRRDYRLVFLLLPLGLFVREGKPSRYDLLLCWLFGCLLIPKNYLILDQDRNIGMLLNPLLLLLLTITLYLASLRGAASSVIIHRAAGHGSTAQQCIT